ncbi:MAG: hypothetical protein MRZ79_04750 [Bacteroidia bacterium]|nr:hypothetical protein [Bacteroidia bacterium]
MSNTFSSMFITPEVAEMALAGLGLQNDGTARKAAFATLKHANKLVSREQLLFGTVYKDLTEDTRQAIMKGELQLQDNVLFIAGTITGGSGLKYLVDEKNNTPITVGLKNFANNKLPAGQNKLVTSIMLEFANSATITDPALADYDNISNSIPAAVLNGELQIKVGGKEKLEMQLSQFFNPGGSYSALPSYFGALQLKTPFLIREDKNIQIAYQLPAGGTLTGNNFLKVKMLGPITAPNS